MKSISLETKLDNDFLNRDDIQEFLGKEVKIVLTEIEEKSTPGQNLAKKAGVWKLGDHLDSLNIRDLAYE